MITLPPHLLPVTKQRRARLDRHLVRQKRYKENLAKKNAPPRTEFAILALDFVLILIDRRPASALSREVFDMIVNQLVAGGFDREQCRIRLDQMCQRVDKDHDRRTRHRRFDAERRAAIERTAAEVFDENKGTAGGGATSAGDAE